MNKALPAKEKLPRHVGIIMDGNGRWAQSRGLSRSEGHRAGAKVFRKITEYAIDLGIKHLTFYAFSTENWQRPKEEVAALMTLFREYLAEAEEKKAENEKRGVRIRFIGDTDMLPPDIVEKIKTAHRETENEEQATVNVAINYGGRQEILYSVRQIAGILAAGELLPEEISEQTIAEHLYTHDQPDPDLIIRPSGEQRLSNFLIWQSAYAEFWYSDVLWPDFSSEDFDKAIIDYANRNRRFGGI